jgi:alpha-glucosidase
VTAWWRDAVTYQIYVRSFADSNGDGVGDLPGVLAHLDHVADLGVDAVWLTPFYPSPMRDHGYDVADYTNVDPLFGTVDDVDRIIHAAHRRALRVILDIVPNHTSSDHPWFRDALADPSSPYRNYYLFRPARDDGGPPNDWQSAFGGSAWSRDPDSGEFYLHLFDESQPDLNWRNPAVRDQFRMILRYWLDRGVDGFRIDVAHALIKDARFRDGQEHATDNDEVLDIWREWRALVDGYGDTMLVGEVFLYDQDRVARYVGDDRLHLAFDFSVAKARYEPAALRTVLHRAVELFGRPGAAPTWVLSNHDLVRHASRYGGGECGRRRARAVTAFVLALPGAPFLYQGEELGLEQSDVPPEQRQDPVWLRSGRVGRDGARTPMPWSADPPGHGFSDGVPWLPFDDQAVPRAVDRQLRDEGSTLHFYRRALATRRELRRHTVDTSVRWPSGGEDVIVAARTLRDRGEWVAVLNLADSERQLALAGRAELLLASADGARLEGTALRIPADATVWLRTVEGARA